MISSNFYKLYRMFLSSNPLFPRYIRWIYKKTLDDLQKANMPLPVTQKHFTALLCGTCGEITSEIFVKHILSIHPNAHIIILDYGKDQVVASEKQIQKRFPNAHVSYIIADARHSGIPSSSVDFIDTDFMFEYLDALGIDELFQEWRRILKPDGLAAFRAFGTGSWLSRWTYRLILQSFCTLLLQSDIHAHSLSSLEQILERNGFAYRIAGRVFLPFGYRFVTQMQNTTS